MPKATAADKIIESLHSGVVSHIVNTDREAIQFMTDVFALTRGKEDHCFDMTMNKEQKGIVIYLEVL